MFPLSFARVYVASRKYCRLFRSRLYSSSTAEDKTAVARVSDHLPTTKKELASSRPVSKKEYGFMESAEILFTEREKPRIIGRWDWHAWQLFVSLLPPFGVFCLAMYARQEMQRMEEEKQSKKVAVWEAELAEEEVKRAPELLKEQQMRERLDVLEAVVKEMQARLERPATDAKPEEIPLQSKAISKSHDPGSDVPAISAAANEASSGWLRWLGLRRGGTPQLGDSKATAGPLSDHPEDSSQSTKSQPGTSSTTQAASSRSPQPRSGESQSRNNSTLDAASKRDPGCQSSGVSTADDCAPGRASSEVSSGGRPGGAKAGVIQVAKQHEPAQAGSGGWWLPSLAAWLLPGDGQLSRRAQTEASGASSAVRAAQEAGSVDSGGESSASAEQPPLKARSQSGKSPDPSQTLTHRRMSEDHARDAEQYKKWREERRKRATNNEAP